MQKTGFDPGGYDGRLGTKTVEAIRAFRARAGIAGPTELTGDFLTALFGANGTLSGDDNPANDSACVSANFGTQPVAAVPPSANPPVAVASVPPQPAIEPAPAAPEQPHLTPSAPTPPQRAEPRKRQQATTPVAPRRPAARRPAPPIDDDDDDDTVVVYTSPPRRATAGGRPVIIYPDGSYRRWGDPTVLRP